MTTNELANQIEKITALTQIKWFQWEITFKHHKNKSLNWQQLIDTKKICESSIYIGNKWSTPKFSQNSTIRDCEDTKGIEKKIKKEIDNEQIKNLKL